MSQKKKSVSGVVELPHPSTSPTVDRLLVPPYVLLNPNGGEIYKVDARYPTQPPTRQCKFMIYWKGGPAGNTSITLVDIKNWVVIAPIWAGLNVGTGQIGSAQFTIPANFKPSDDSSCPSTYPLKPGKYQIYIQNNPATTWTYGPEFTIVWDY